MSRWTCSTLACVLASVAGCAPAPRTLRWSIEFATPDLRARSEVVVARVLAGGCTGGVIHEARLTHAGTGPMDLGSPLLGPGVFGLAAFAVDHDCAWVASDCREVTLPMNGTTTLFLRDEATAPRCPADVCGVGRCAAADAGVDTGPFDAAPFDAGPFDAPPRDAPLVDTGARDAYALDSPDVGRDGATRDAAMCTASAPAVTGSSTAMSFLRSVVASGSTLTFEDFVGTTGTINLSGGVTATGTAVASCPDSGVCFGFIAGVVGSGNTLTFTDGAGMNYPITLIGATASGSFAMAGGASLSGVVSTMGNRITFSTWTFMGPPLTGDITLLPVEVCR